MWKQPRPVQDSLSWKQLLKRVAIGAAIIVSFFGALSLVNAWYLIIRTHPEIQPFTNEREPEAVFPRSSEKAAHQPQTEASQEDLTFFRSLTETERNEVLIPEQTASDRSTPPAAAPPKPEPAGSQTKPGTASYAVQIGAFKSLASAEQVQARLRQEGLNTSVAKATLADGSVWYRVRMAAPLPRPEAEALASRLKKEGNLNPVLLPVN